MKNVCHITTLLLLLLISRVDFVEAQHSPLVGPLLGSTLVGGQKTLFQDIGSGEVSSIESFNDPFYIQDWSPDGCKILIFYVNDQTWRVLNISDYSTRNIPTTKSQPIWYTEGSTLTYAQLKSNSTTIHNYNLKTNTEQALFSVDGSVGPVKWLSPSQLLYVRDGEWYVWDSVTDTSVIFSGSGLLKNQSLFHKVLAPDGKTIAKFYSMDDYESYFSSNSESTSESLLETLKSIPQTPGVEIIFLDNKVSTKVDIHGQFIQSLAWSPSSNRLAVSTYPPTTAENLNGIYIYEIEGKSFQRVDGFPVMVNSEYGSYLPSWSPDSNWLAFNTQNGYVIYNLISHEIKKLSEKFSGLYMSVSWSPVMNYREVNCSNEH